MFGAAARTEGTKHTMIMRLEKCKMPQMQIAGPHSVEHELPATVKTAIPIPLLEVCAESIPMLFCWPLRPFPNGMWILTLPGAEPESVVDSKPKVVWELVMMRE